MHKNFIRWSLPAWLWGIFIVIMTSLPRVELPKLGITFTDKLVHAGVYALFAFLVLRARSHNETEKIRPAIKWTAIFCTIFAILDEVHQIFIPNRFGDVSDAAADIFGVAMAILFFYYIFMPLFVLKNRSSK